MNDSLYQRVKQSGLKMEYVANKVGLSRKGLYLKFIGRIPFKDNEIKIIEDLLKGLK